MPLLDSLNVGIVGAAGRGRTFRAALEANRARVHAVCDARAEKLPQIAEALGAAEQYADYGEMLERSQLDAVVVATPMQFHVPMSLMALERGLHVLSEVPAAISIEECKQLVAACRDSGRTYMMAENYCYRKQNVFVRELSRAGLFGRVYYAEGEYLHELKLLNEQTPWRRKWQTGIDGITYGTHSLGPILQCTPGQRVERVCCEGSGHHYTDPRGDEYHQDTSVMLCKMSGGGLVKIRVDMLSDRPHAMTNYQLQGTDGAYESSRGGPDERAKIWLRAVDENMRWHDVEELASGALAQYLPDDWRNPPKEALEAGHGGGDYFEVRDFVRAIRGEAPCPIGIHEAMDMTLPGLVSQESIARGGQWLPVPDSRAWPEPERRPQLQMLLPEEVAANVPAPTVPDGYLMRQYTPDDATAYLELMHRAGFERFDEKSLPALLAGVIPDGFFVVEHKASGAIVATAMARHRPSPLHPFGAELSWVAADPEHRGKGLGTAVSLAAIRRFVQAGYRRIYLLTDDWRLPAIKIYLQLGLEPMYHCEGMRERWEEVREKLGWGAG